MCTGVISRKILAQVSLRLSHDGGTDPLVNTRITVTLGGGYGSFKGFIFRTTAGTLTPKTNAANAQYCSGAVGHTESSSKSTAEAYLDLPSTPGTVTVTAEAVMAVDDVYELTVDVHVVAVDTTWTEVKTSLLWSGEPRRHPMDSHTGYSVSMSSNGSRVAIGSYNVNEVRVVDYDEATTTEKEVFLRGGDEGGERLGIRSGTVWRWHTFGYSWLFTECPSRLQV